jgi:hypothetical protein
MHPSILSVHRETTMMNGLVSALLVLAGGACAVAGYVIGSWHQRRAIEAELEGDLFTDRIVDLFDPVAPRDQRLN